MDSLLASMRPVAKRLKSISSLLRSTICRQSCSIDSSCGLSSAVFVFRAIKPVARVIRVSGVCNSWVTRDTRSLLANYVLFIACCTVDKTRAWARCLGDSVYEAEGTAYIPKNAVYHVTKPNHKKIDAVFYRLC